MVGRIGRAHGIRGEVSVQTLTDEPERRFAPGSSVVVRPQGRTLTVTASRPHQGRLLVAFAEVDDRTAAESLRGAQLVSDVDVEDRPDDPEEFYDHQLVGLAVEVAGTARGTVVDVLHLPSQDVLAVRRADGAEVLVPFVTALVPEVDLDGGRVEVADVPGLLDPEEADVSRESDS